MCLINYRAVLQNDGGMLENNSCNGLLCGERKINTELGLKHFIGHFLSLAENC